MNQLFPIIRRQRRPLLPVEDAPPMVVGNVEPPKVESTSKDASPAESKPEVEKHEADDAETPY